MNLTPIRSWRGGVAPGFYRLQSRARPEWLAALAGRNGWRYVYLDGARIASKAEFMAAVAQAMQFPGYFGRNWDALEDSLRDLAWLPARSGYLVLYDAAGKFARQQPDEFAVALDVLRSAVDFWRGTPTPMTVLVRGAGRLRSPVRLR
jgi:RNAse (barnase) inhibitor barstar